MAHVDCKGEVIYDLYCGIGYYSVPLLYYGGARRIYAFEWNPNSVAAMKCNFNYQNIDENRVVIIEGDNRVNVPMLEMCHHDGDLLGPCPATSGVTNARARKHSLARAYKHYNNSTIPLLQKESPPEGLPRADRVMLGLLPSSKDGWRLAVEVLKLSGGILHVHENIHERLMDKTCTGFPVARDVPTADLTEEDGYFPDFLVKRFEFLFAEHDLKLKLALPPMKVSVVHMEVVKSYAPRVFHVVVDLVCRRIHEV